MIGIAGDIRLAWLTRIFRLDLTRATLDGETALPASQIVEQVLYESIADALGFSQNRAAMCQLARSVPLAALPRAAPLSPGLPGYPSQRRYDPADGCRASTHRTEALTSAAPAARRCHLATKHHLAPAQGPHPSLAGQSHSAGQRARAAHRRAGGAGGLLAAAQGLGSGRAPAPHAAGDSAGSGRRRTRPWQTLAALVRQPAPPPAVVRHLRRLGIWSGNEETPTALIGASRAADIVVNVLLPYTLAVARDGPPGTGHRARRVFLEHPLLTENWITRLMTKRTGYRARTAREQQGLIRLYEHFSHSLFCQQCPLGEIPPPVVTNSGNA